MCGDGSCKTCCSDSLSTRPVGSAASLAWRAPVPLGLPGELRRQHSHRPGGTRASRSAAQHQSIQLSPRAQRSMRLRYSGQLPPTRPLPMQWGKATGAPGGRASCMWRRQLSNSASRDCAVSPGGRGLEGCICPNMLITLPQIYMGEGWGVEMADQVRFCEVMARARSAPPPSGSRQAASTHLDLSWRPLAAGAVAVCRGEGFEHGFRQALGPPRHAVALVRNCICNERGRLEVGLAGRAVGGVESRAVAAAPHGGARRHGGACRWRQCTRPVDPNCSP